MFNRLFSALENTRASISQAFRGISAVNITGEQLDNIEEQLFLADIGYDTVENIIKIIKKFKNDDFLAEVKKYLIMLVTAVFVPSPPLAHEPKFKTKYVRNIKVHRPLQQILTRCIVIEIRIGILSLKEKIETRLIR